MTEEATSAKEAVKDAERALAKTLAAAMEAEGAAALAEVKIAATAAAEAAKVAVTVKKHPMQQSKKKTASTLDVGSKENDLLTAAVYYHGMDAIVCS